MAATVRKHFLLNAVLGTFILTSTSFAVEFSDVSKKHWAHEFVQKVVEAGIVAGFPDGTFRGNKTISRFEIAKMISNLMELYGNTSANSLDDLQVDLKALKAELQALKSAHVGTAPITGSFTARGRLGSILSAGARSPRSDYRLMTGFEQKLGGDASLQFGLDTADTGYNNAAATNLFQDLIDVTASLPWKLGWENPAKVRVTFGPGPILHLEPGGLILDEEKYIVRPRTGFSFSTPMAGVDLTANYFVRGGSRVTGIITSHHFQFSPEIDISHWISREGTKLSGTVDWISQAAGGATTADLLATMRVKTKILPKLEAQGVLGVTGFATSGLHLGLDLVADNILGATKTVIDLSIHRVGSAYINGADEFDLAGYDYFGRARRNGTWDVGVKISQPWGEVWSGIFLWNMKTDGSFQNSGQSSMNVLRADLIYTVSNQTRITTSYERYSRLTTGTADLLSAALTYDF